MSVAPGIARIRVAVGHGGPSYLSVEAVNDEAVFQNPGSPSLSGSGANTVAWVLDRNALRTAPLLDPATPRPVLYAFDTATLTLLWRSGEGELGPSGKYSSPIIANSMVFVGTDRIEAFGP